MEGDGHDAVREVEGLLDAVAVVDVDIDVQHPLVSLQELQDGEHDVVHVAEPRGFCLLGVVHPAAPVEGHVHVPLVDQRRGVHRAATVRLAVLVHAVKHRTAEHGCVGGVGGGEAWRGERGFECT